MARLGVRFEDVAQAAAAIRDGGEEPTIDRVRQTLGTGSKSTLAPLLKRWKAQQCGDQAGDVLPADLLKAVRNLHELTQQAADEQIEAARKDFADLEVALQQKLAEKMSELQELQQQHSALSHSHEKLQAKHQQLNDAHHQVRASAAAQGAELGEVRLRLEESRLAVDELKQQSKQARAQAEHYQQAVAEERRLEREHVQQLKAEWQSAREDWAERMSAELALRKTLEKDHRDLDARRQDLEQREARLTAELEAKRLDNQRYQQVNGELTAEMSALKERRAEDGIAIAEMRTAQKHLELSCRQSGAQNERLELRLVKTEEKADRLSDENNLLKQERAELLEKLRQSQDEGFEPKQDGQ